MADTDPLDLDAIKARADAATAGPWTTDKWTRGAYFVGEVPGGRPGGEVIGSTQPTMMALKGYPASAQHANAEFIAAARSDIPALLDLVARLRDQLAEAQALIPFDGQLALDENDRLRDAIAEAYEQKVAAEGVVARIWDRTMWHRRDCTFADEVLAIIDGTAKPASEEETRFGVGGSEHDGQYRDSPAPGDGEQT